MLCFSHQMKAQMQPPPPCTVSTITLPTNDVQNGSTPLTFKAIDYVEASNTITTNFVGGANITYEAGKAVTLNPGFKTDYGTTFKARIDPCMNPNPSIDLEVDLYAMPEQSIPELYRCIFEVSNNSNVTATGVQAQFVGDSNANPVGYSPAQGTTYDETTGVWDIGILASNTTIVMEMFLEGIPGETFFNFGQIIAANETDVDSVPNNWAGSPLEDDEMDAVVTLPPPPPFMAKTTETASIDALQETILSEVSCYPNPFAEQTNIEFTLSKDSEVSVVVSDITGKQLAILLDQKALSIGTHNVSFEAQGFPNGTYIYSIQTNQTTISHRMILNQ